MTDPCVAIVTRTQNRPLTLDRTMRSILAQQFQDWQMVLVSDAGNLDSIRQVLARYADAMRGRCLLLHRETSTGMEAASNFGMSRSSSRYVVVHDDDDSWHPDFLGKAVAFLRSFGDTFQGVVTGTELVFERIDNGAIRELRREAMARPPDPLTPAALRRRNRFPPISFLYERKAGQLAGGYREDLRALGDWSSMSALPPISASARFPIPSPIGTTGRRRPPVPEATPTPPITTTWRA